MKKMGGRAGPNLCPEKSAPRDYVCVHPHSQKGLVT